MVIASDRYSAADGANMVEVDYEELPVIVDPHKSMAADAPVIREDIADKDNVGHGKRTHPNHIFTWEAGDKAAADAAFASADVTVKEEILNPRVHPCPLETCGCVASFDKVTGQLTVYMTSQAPHLVRTVVAMLSGIPESKIRIVGGDIGGGFGNKVPVYPGYVVAIVASIVTGVPIKWIESRIDNISTTGFARDYHGVGELAADKDGRIKALRFTALADHGAFNSHVSATKLPAGLFSICTGSYAIPKAYCRVDAVYTNKAPGGVAYRCSLRVTEAVYLIERMIDVLAQKLGLDKAEIRRRNFVKAEQFPYTTAFGWTLDSGAYHTALDKVLKAVDYDGLRREQAEKRAKGELMGIGISTFTEIVGAGPTKVCDILGIGLFDSCDIRVNPTGSAIARLGTMSQGQGHATTYARHSAIAPRSAHGPWSPDRFARHDPRERRQRRHAVQTGLEGPPPMDRWRMREGCCRRCGAGGDRQGRAEARAHFQRPASPRRGCGAVHDGLREQRDDRALSPALQSAHRVVRTRQYTRRGRGALPGRAAEDPARRCARRSSPRLGGDARPG